MPQQFQLLAQPWWVNLLILIPLVVFWNWRGKGLRISWSHLAFSAAFATAFGCVEAAVVVYLRAAIGLLPGFQGTLSDIVRSSGDIYQKIQTVQFPQSLLLIELFREAATMIMLLAVACLSSTRLRERWAVFLWTFAIWDTAYYAGLWATIRWPKSWLDPDVLFLIPVPWMSQVWFPVLVSCLTVAAIAWTKFRTGLATQTVRATVPSGSPQLNTQEPPVTSAAVTDGP
jgi:hypothetical protein